MGKAGRSLFHCLDLYLGLSDQEHDAPRGMCTVYDKADIEVKWPSRGSENKPQMNTD